MATSSSSWGMSLVYGLVNGETLPSPSIIANFRVGDNSIRPGGLPEFTLLDGEDEDAQKVAGHLTWDAAHAEATGCFFSVAPVRLEICPEGARWAVGTSDFICLHARPFKTIERIQIVARVANSAPHRVIHWDFIDLTLHHAGGTVATHSSPCLPRLATATRIRQSRAQSAKEPKDSTIPQQFADIIVASGDVTKLAITAQVTLRANHAGSSSSPLEPDDLTGRILVFTEAGSSVTK